MLFKDYFNNTSNSYLKVAVFLIGVKAQPVDLCCSRFIIGASEKAFRVQGKSSSCQGLNLVRFALNFD